MQDPTPVAGTALLTDKLARERLWKDYTAHVMTLWDTVLLQKNDSLKQAQSDDNF